MQTVSRGGQLTGPSQLKGYRVRTRGEDDPMTHLVSQVVLVSWGILCMGATLPVAGGCG